jgi:hypothetical protein
MPSAAAVVVKGTPPVEREDQAAAEMAPCAQAQVPLGQRIQAVAEARAVQRQALVVRES